MANFEAFTYKGKEYKFRVGRSTPEVKPLIKYKSDYYKNKQKSLSWAMWLSFIPVVILAIIYFAYVGSDNPGGALGWFPLLAFPYGIIIYITHEKIQDADKTLLELQKHAEDEEYLDAYEAWISQQPQ